MRIRNQTKRERERQENKPGGCLLITIFEGTPGMETFERVTAVAKISRQLA